MQHTGEQWNSYMRRYNANLRVINPEKWKEKIQRDNENRKKRWPQYLEKQRVRMAERRETDPEFRKRGVGYVKKDYLRIRGQILSAYGSHCACCGETEPLFLEVDHKHGGGAKEFRESKSPTTLYSRIIKEGFPDKYQLLCCNCNKGRTRNGGICPHAKEYPKAVCFE